MDKTVSVIVHSLFAILSFIGMVLTSHNTPPYFIFDFIAFFSMGLAINSIIGKIIEDKE